MAEQYGAEGSTSPAGTSAPISTNGLSVMIAVLTYQRPDDLAAALPALVEQARTLQPAARVLVVDNDPAGGATPLVAATAGQTVRYVQEPQPGIAAARNRALHESADDDLLVFIDDDERPSSHWLRDLVGTYLAGRPAAVVGPVVSEFSSPPDPWIAAGRFFQRRRLPTGSVVDIAATNNLLLDLGHVRRTGLTFDDRFGLLGGSDTLFTRQLARAGGRMVWCDSAVVVDVVPPQRLTREWVLRRAYRMGNSWSRTTLALSPSPARRAGSRLVLTGRGCARVLLGAGRMGIGRVTSSLEHQARGRRTVARGAGLLAGAAGSVYAEYARPVPPIASGVPIGDQSVLPTGAATATS